jgi:hypothetical protein
MKVVMTMRGKIKKGKVLLDNPTALPTVRWWKFD